MGATYVNPGLVIRARSDLTPLVAELNRVRLDQIGVVKVEGGVWRVTFQADRVHGHPSQAMDRMFDVVENLGAEHGLAWDRCIDRGLDLGFEGSDESLYSRWEIGAARLRRLVCAIAWFVVTTYRSSQGCVTQKT